jgi:uncharacterized protein
MILILVLLGVSMLISWQFRRRAKNYSEVALRNNLSGAEIAQQMLHDNGIFDVRIISVEGQLTDHYNPQYKTVNLSQEVYHGRSVLAAAVAAHECGHAVQHAKAYAWLNFRSAIVPAVSFASRWVQWILLAGILMLNRFPELLLVGIVLFAAITLFSFITLPVEFDASKRAMAWLDQKGILYTEEYGMAKSALSWAASTYVIAAISSLATLLYYISIFNSRRN